MRVAVALVLLALAGTAAAQPVASTRHYFAWDHDQVNTDRYELRVDQGPWTAVPTEARVPGTHRTPVPAMEPGAHTVAVRACNAVCSGELTASFTFVLVPVDPTALRVERGEP